MLVVLIPAGLALSSVYKERDDRHAHSLDVAQAGCLFVILIGIVGGAVQATQIILRFINVGVINMTFKTYGIVVSMQL